MVGRRARMSWRGMSVGMLGGGRSRGIRLRMGCMTIRLVDELGRTQLCRSVGEWM